VTFVDLFHPQHLVATVTSFSLWMMPAGFCGSRCRQVKIRQLRRLRSFKLCQKQTQVGSCELFAQIEEGSSPQLSLQIIVQNKGCDASS
jgi:hypothetical protein